MVKRGLKAGDTFVEGGITYVVKSVLSDGNYISRKCGDLPVTEQEEAQEPVTEQEEAQEPVTEQEEADGKKKK